TMVSARISSAGRSVRRAMASASDDAVRIALTPDPAAQAPIERAADGALTQTRTLRPMTPLLGEAAPILSASLRRRPRNRGRMAPFCTVRYRKPWIGRVAEQLRSVSTSDTRHFRR